MKNGLSIAYRLSLNLYRQHNDTGHGHGDVFVEKETDH